MLRCNERAREYFFGALVWPWLSLLLLLFISSFKGESVDRMNAGRKRELFGDLTGTVVDIGSGLGVNFKYFAEVTAVNRSDDNEQNVVDVSSVVAIEPNAEMIEPLRAEALKNSNDRIQFDVFHGTLLDYANAFPRERVDHVVSTYVLCSIPNVRLWSSCLELSCRFLRILGLSGRC